MPLLDIFKRKKIKKEKERIKPEEIKDYYPPTTLPIKGGAPEKPPNKAKPLKVKESKIGDTWRVLKTPQVTEKAAGLVGQNQYVFKVWPRANKVEAKKAIEGLYGVDVISVKIIKVPRKRRRLGKIQGFRKGYKKAIVKIKEGQKIEVLPR